MEKNLIFIVGNSRSGTTMVGSILNMNKKVFTFEELHFFGQLWSEDNLGKTINYLEASRLLKKLFIIQRELGYFGDIDIDDKTYEKEIKIILDKTSIYTLESIFSDFLFYETQLNDKSIPCEQTPRNLFYMKEILRIFPNVKIINMVRDPRDVLLSQKNKWKVRKNGISNIPFKEVFRSWINYHPLTISKLWTSSIKMSELYEDKILNIRFEDLIFNSEKTVSKICDYLGIEFDNNMLE
ncbi:sulfotransferase, partial [archaeon]|nr:sulfotransferase [archaeon]